MSALLIIGVTMANIAGVRWGAGIQIATVASKLVTIAIVICVAISSNPASSISPSPVGPAHSPGLAVLFAAIVPTFFAYGGVQHALWIAGEVRHPLRNLPLAIVGGVVVVVIAYVGVNWAYLHLLGYSDMLQSKTLAADAVARVWPQWGARATAGAVAISAF